VGSPVSHQNKRAPTLSRNDGETKQVKSDFVLGCDGAFSNVRKALAKKAYFNFSQEYIPHAYLELCIPQTQQGDVSCHVNTLLLLKPVNFVETIAAINLEIKNIIFLKIKLPIVNRKGQNQS